MTAAAHRSYGVFAWLVLVWAVVGPAGAGAQARRAPTTIDRLEVVAADDGVSRGRLMAQSQALRSALTTCRGTTRQGAVRIVLRLGDGDADVIDTVRYEGERDETLERCVRDALAEWRPPPDVGSGAAEIELRREPLAVRSTTGIMGLLGTLGGAGGGVQGALIGGLRAPTFGPAATGVGVMPATPRARASVVELTTAGPLGAAAARRVVTRSLSRLSSCTGDAQWGEAERQERQVRINVADGRTMSVWTARASHRVPRADACIVRALRETAWPAQPGGVTTVTVTLGFEPTATPAGRVRLE